MGLLDAINNMTPEQTQGLLGMASQMLQASGPSTRPVSFGQALGAGLEGYQVGSERERLRKLREQEAAQMAKYRGLQIQNMESDNATQQAMREREEQIRAALAGMSPQGAQPSPSNAPLGGSIMAGQGTPPPSWMPQQQAAPTMGSATPSDPREVEASRLIQEAAIRRQYGDSDGAIKRLEAAYKLMPEFSQAPQVGLDSNNKLVNYVLDKQGNPKVLDIAPRPEIKEIALGNRKLFRDLNTVQDGDSFAMGYSPGDLVSMRGQNMVDQRSRDANAIAASGKVVERATGLRKEFDDLPEVKNYKQALPAFTAIKDAASRNTTQSDINIVYGLAKLYDPTSVVREGEYATVANSPNIPERVKGYAQYLQGGGRLTEAVKKQILDEASGRMGSYEQPYLQARGNYTSIAQRTGADPSQIFPSEYQSPIGFSVTAPNGKTYNFPDAKSLANFKLKAGIR